MRFIFQLLFLSLFVVNSFGQKFYENKEVGIKVQAPFGWKIATDSMLEKNLKKIDFKEGQITEILSSNKGLLSLVAYYKYSPDSVSGLIPTVKITVRLNPSSNFEEFQQIMEESTHNMKTILNDFVMTDSIKEIKISNRRCLYYCFDYSLQSKNAGKIQVRAKYYMIPKGEYFISISLMDNRIDDDCSALYSHLIRTLEL